MFSFHIIVKIRINRHTRVKTLYKLIHRGIFYHAFFLFACERSFETALFCLKFWLFSSRPRRKMVLSIFSKSERRFEKQTTPRLVAYWYLSMDKIWTKFNFWPWPPIALYLQTFVLKSFSKLQGLQYYFVENLRCKLAHCESEIFSWFLSPSHF